MENLRIINQVVKNEVNDITELETVKIENRKLKDELSNRNQLIEVLRRNIKKIDFVIAEWFSDYSFNAKPDPKAAIEYARNLLEQNGKDMHGEQSFKWFWEYNRIHQLMEIANDYIFKSMEEIIEKQEARQ